MVCNSSVQQLERIDHFVSINLEALKSMTHVADYINEVQRLCETYGTILDSLSKDMTLSEV